ncbi:MAG: aldo/keto reductase [Phycisphaerales bacterium]
MQQVELKPLGRRVSCLGLGCARMDGRVGLKRSARLIETALSLGITYFDVAAMYGTAEEAVGHVIGNSKDVVVATKVGPPRPGYDARKARIRAVLKPMLDHARGLKMMLRGRVVAMPTSPAVRPRYDFSQAAIERSLEESLRYLKRDSVDVFLAHEPHPDDLTPATAARFQALVDRGLVKAFGAGVDVREDRWARFGSIWQSGWPAERVRSYKGDTTYVFHGVMRYAETDRSGRTLTPTAELIRRARSLAPNAVILFSASTPERIRQVVRAAEEAGA